MDFPKGLPPDLPNGLPPGLPPFLRSNLPPGLPPPFQSLSRGFRVRRCCSPCAPPFLSSCRGPLSRGLRSAGFPPSSKCGPFPNLPDFGPLPNLPGLPDFGPLPNCQTCRALTARRHCALDDPRAPRPADHHATRRGPCSWGDAGGPRGPCCGICPAVFHLVCHAETMITGAIPRPTLPERCPGPCGRDAVATPAATSRVTAQDGNPQPPSRRCR